MSQQELVESVQAKLRLASTPKPRRGVCRAELFEPNPAPALRLYQGDSAKILRDMPANSVDLIVTSPPYADQRKEVYGGIHADKYVEWFLPISDGLFHVLKPTGSFVLNIKERVVDGERHTYVMELIIEMRKRGWLWT